MKNNILQILLGLVTVILSPVWLPIMLVGMLGYVIWAFGGAVQDCIDDLLEGLL